MTWLAVGLVIWFAAHLFKRMNARARAMMQERMGDASKGVFAAIILISVVLMVIGYRGAAEVPVYDPPSWGRHVNNLLMFVAVVLFGLGSSKSPFRSKMRHPMLTGVIVWVVAHLLANGDQASLLLFGMMGLWAIAEFIVINRAEPDYAPFDGGSTAGTIRLLVISVVVYAVIAGIHTWLGYWPFPG